MRKRFCKRLSSFILCMVLIVAMALSVGCNGSEKGEEPDGGDSGVRTEGQEQADEKEKQAGNVLGAGDMEFPVTVTDQEGNTIEFEIHTDQETVGDALEEVGMIEGEEGEYGLYVKTVNGITLDYDEDGLYWAFYINDEYAQTGVDATPIKEGESYSFKAEK